MGLGFVGLLGVWPNSVIGLKVMVLFFISVLLQFCCYYVYIVFNSDAPRVWGFYFNDSGIYYRKL